MLDFVSVRTSTKNTSKKGFQESIITVYPEFLVKPSKDLMVRGKKFYAIWDEEAGMWTKDINRACEMIDTELISYKDRYPEDVNIVIQRLQNFGSRKWTEFMNYCMSLPDSYHELDTKLIFADTPVEKSDYATKRLPYQFKDTETKSYDELIGTLYSESERQKLEWAIGAVIAGDSKNIQKFVVLYGSYGTGKSTMLDIIQQLFDGYFATFDAKSLGNSSSSFALEQFKGNPLVAIQHDGDLSRIEDNTRLNSIISHEYLVVNEKFKSTYSMRFNSFLFMGTNRPVKITDGKSGIVRRLIDVTPTGETIPVKRYQSLVSCIKFELGGIAKHCLEVYTELGPDAYNKYRSLEMIGATDHFYSFVEENYDLFSQDNGTSLSEAWPVYKRYCEESKIKYPYSKQRVKEELKTYFLVYEERATNQDGRRYNLYSGFKKDKFSYGYDEINKEPNKLETTIILKEQDSIFDEVYSKCLAQYANDEGHPKSKWANVKSTLSELDTSKLHYVRVPAHHIVIDFDKKDPDGNKSLNLSLKAASKWPSTYTEISKGGNGVHLHYIYDGDPRKLSNLYDEDIEVKVFNGKSALRRKLTLCNDLAIATISSGLPFKKGGGTVIDFEGLKNEKALRTLIKKNLNKEIHPGTKPSIDFIYKILTEYHESEKPYDVSDMRPSIMAFANNSTNHSLYCMKLVNKMPFISKTESKESTWGDDDEIVFYDVEVFKNLFVVVWKKAGKNPVKMINPTAEDIERLLRFKLVGFNCRRYDNHILYARVLGYDNAQLYALSKKIINGSKNCMFMEAYNLSYSDVYDFSSKKQSLKKFEIDLGIHHQELGLPWDEPVDDNKWELVADYCVNDVVATEAVFDARHEDFMARCMLANLSGLSVNDTTRKHATKIIFGDDKHPQDKFVYTDLSKEFKGYKFDAGKSSYRGEDPGEGGYVYSEPGQYENVALLDIEGMHPTSLIQLNMFGDEYTETFKSLVDARVLIKHGDYEAAKKMLGGKLSPYLGSVDECKELAYALKIIVNSIYGYTWASFDCEFRDPRNKDNIVAKRGALFMIDLKNEVQKKGFTVAHIKTDSIKIPNATKEIIEFVTKFGHKYGYTFEHEATYEKMCLVNDTVYIAKEEGPSGKWILRKSCWTATGTQFAVPYVFKTLFSGEKIEFDDLCVTKSVTGTSDIYLDMNEGMEEDKHSYHFVGKAGRFTPIKPGFGGGLLMRKKDGKYYAVGGSKGYRWMESEVVKDLGKENDVDISYYDSFVDDAKKAIGEFGSFEEFAKEN